MTRRNFPPSLAAALLSFSCLIGLSVHAAEPVNEVVLNIEPSREHPRNSEGSFVTLKSGRILFAYTRFNGGSRDESPAQIVSIYSDDQGRTWSKEPQNLVEHQQSANVMSVSLLRLHSGAIALFYVAKHSLLDCRPMMSVSEDEAEHWSEPKLVVTAPGYFVLNNDRVIQLHDGRLIMPLAFHRSRTSDPKNHYTFDSRGIVLWYLSDDEGKTWREAGDWWALPVRSHSGFQEPGVIELADGSVFCWTRTDQGAQFACRSADKGKSWPQPEKTTLQSPESPASIKRLPNSTELLAIYNDHSGKFDFPKGKRSPLVAAISSDDGKTWPRRKLLESDPDGWYCYTAIHYTTDAVLLAYCAGDSKIGGLNRLRIRRLSLDWSKTN
jgi:sialidase-1